MQVGIIREMNKLSIAGGLELVDLAIYLPSYRALAIADLHLGFAEALREDGTLLPEGSFRKIWERCGAILAHLSISEMRPLERVIINGDLRHKFGPLSAQEWSEAHKLLAQLSRFSRSIVVLEGNHDAGLGALAKGQVKVCRSCKLGDLLFIHGDEEPDRLPEDVGTIIIGHEHPAVGLRDRVTGRVELYKCFLVGEYRGRRLIVQPSFNPMVAGSDLMRESSLSPLLDVERLEEFEVYPVSDGGRVYRFGPLGLLMGGKARWSAS